MPAPKSAATLDALRSKHDPRTVTRNKILAQLAALKKRGSVWQYEQDFMREAVISPVHMRIVKSDFVKHIAYVNEIGRKAGPRSVWFVNVADAATIRKEQDAIKSAMATTVE